MTKENKCPNCGYDLNKKRYDWTTEEIIEAMKRICPVKLGRKMKEQVVSNMVGDDDQSN